MNTTDIKLLYVDLFAGAGGTSTGVENAKNNGSKCAKVIACVNHDKNAILSHAANHPDTLHFTEDIRTLDLTILIKHIAEMRVIYPNALLVLWASLECTNFSKAKGGLPRDADSRTLANSLFRYIAAIDPDYIKIENVEEFMSWGPLDDNGKPISKLNGSEYIEWRDIVKDHLYDYDHRILNSADYGARTSRKRFFGVFAKCGLPIIFPEPTHAKKPTGKLKKWRAVKDVLQLDDAGSSIFGRKKPLVDATLLRIHAGLVKFVAGGKSTWLMKYNSVNGLTGKHTPPAIEDPCPVVSCQSRLGIVSTEFLAGYYGNGDNVSSIENVCPTLRTKDTVALISTQFIDMRYGTGTPMAINIPAGTLTQNPKHSLITPFIMDTAFNNIGTDIENPSGVITANRKWQYLVNPQYSSAGGDVNDPCFTLIARMDKSPVSIATAETSTDSELPDFIKITPEGVIYEIYETDTAAMVAIKEFMAMYGIRDIKMRMLKIPELLQIMGFPINYTLIGTQAEQKKYIGNAVETTMAKVLCEALARELIEQEEAA